MHVLVVDDEATNREIAEIILRSEGHSVARASDGAAALGLCLDEGQHFDLILMDILMPGLDGLETTRQLRAHPDTCDVPILAVSAKASALDHDLAHEAGCDHFLTKPYRRNQLIEAVEQTLRERTIALHS